MKIGQRPLRRTRAGFLSLHYVLYLQALISVIFLLARGQLRSGLPFADSRPCEEARLLAPSPLWR